MKVRAHADGSYEHVDATDDEMTALVASGDHLAWLAEHATVVSETTPSGLIVPYTAEELAALASGVPSLDFPRAWLDAHGGTPPAPPEVSP